MAAARNAAPLIHLDAVVIDTNTTGLDPSKARVIEVAAVRLANGRLDMHAPFRRLVRPAKPNPKQATCIHGIGSFGHLWPELSSHMNGSVVIGHSVSFDLAVLKRECERAGIAWQSPRVLDVRLLAEVATADLPEYSLKGLAAWLGLEMGHRHSALRDAATAGRIFLALLPKLREIGISTLAEAERAAFPRARRTVVGAPAAIEAGRPFELDPYPKKGPKPLRERNCSIARLHNEGKSLSDIATQFHVSRGRAYKIVATHAAQEERRAKLRKRYGERPNITKLPDRTPIDVLILCDTEIPGWASRVMQLQRASIPMKTLGDLRNTTDIQLLQEPQMGKWMLGALRSFCPFRRKHSRKQKR